MIPLAPAMCRTRGCVGLTRTIKGKGVPEIEDKNGWHGNNFGQWRVELGKALARGLPSLSVTWRPRRSTLKLATIRPVSLSC